MNSSMECSIKRQKVEALKKYKRAKFVYNLVLYSLSSMITCLFFTYPFWFPSMNQLLSYDILDNISFLFNAKCSFIMCNLIVLILAWESVVKGPSCSSPASDMYDEYAARSRGNYSHKVNFSEETSGRVPSLDVQEKNQGVKVEEKICREERHKKNKKKKEARACASIAYHNEERKKGMRSCKSESNLAKRENTACKEEKGKGMISCKSDESNLAKRENTCKKEEGKGMISCRSESNLAKRENTCKKEEGKGMISCRSDESNLAKRESTCKKEEGKGMIRCRSESNLAKRENTCKKEEGKGMISCRSEINLAKRENTCKKEEGKGMISCKSESNLAKREKACKEEEEAVKDCMPREELNKRVEAFIARVNKQRSLEAI